MIDVQKKMRMGFYEALNGGVAYDYPVGGPINVAPLTDGKEDSGADVYVILAQQTGTPDNSFSHFGTRATQLLDIVHKTGFHTTKDIVDQVAQSVLNIILPTPSTNGLVAQSGVQFSCVELESDSYLDLQLSGSESITRRLLRFSTRIHQL